MSCLARLLLDIIKVASKLKCLGPPVQKVHARCWFASHDWHRVRFHSNHYRTMIQFDVGIGLRTPSNYRNIQLDSMNPTMSERRLIQFFSLIWAKKRLTHLSIFPDRFGRNLHPWSVNSLPPIKMMLGRRSFPFWGDGNFSKNVYPIGSMYGIIFTYIHHFLPLKTTVKCR